MFEVEKIENLYRIIGYSNKYNSPFEEYEARFIILFWMDDHYDFIDIQYILDYVESNFDSMFISENICFKNKSDANKALQWLESYIMMEKLTNV